MLATVGWNGIGWSTQLTRASKDATIVWRLLKTLLGGLAWLPGNGFSPKVTPRTGCLCGGERLGKERKACLPPACIDSNSDSMATWTTGLLSIWDDFETMLNSTVLCGALIVLLPAHNALELNNGHAACGARHEMLARAFNSCGCSNKDAAMSINLALCCLFPPIAVFWRRQMRDIYSIDGSMIGDLQAYLFCFPCAVMQECRELKKRGVNNLDLPAQMSMASR